jgi:valyl-tRNA synthetase
MNLEDASYPAGEIQKEEYSLPDRWIRGRLNRTVQEVQRSLEAYKFNEASHALYQFIWHEFCDWYLELIKPYLYQDEDGRRKILTQKTLLKVLDATLRLLHPFMPFITEEIWQQLPLKRGNGSIMVSDFPKPNPFFDDEEVADEMGLLIEIITAIRNIRGEMNVPPGEQIMGILRTKDEELKERLERNRSFIQNLAKVKELMIGEEIKKPAYSALAVVRNVEIFIPMNQSRMEEEMKRLQKEILKIEKEIAFVGKKLSNEQFISKAPSEVVQKEKEKVLEYCTTRDKLEENLNKIKRAFK